MWKGRGLVEWSDARLSGIFARQNALSCDRASLAVNHPPVPHQE